MDLCKTRMKLSWIAALCLGLVAASEIQQNEEKIEQGCTPCAGICVGICSDEVKMRSARMAIHSMCHYWEYDNIAAMQTLITKKSTLRTIIMHPEGCLDSGVVPFLTEAISFMPETGCSGNPEIITISVNSKGQVVAKTRELFTQDNLPISVNGQYTFTVDADCRVSLVSAVLLEADCS